MSILSGTLTLTAQFKQLASPGLGSAVNTLAQNYPINFASGTATGEVNVLWSSSRSLSATSEILDLNGVLTDAYGASVNLLRVKGIYVVNLSATDGNNLLVGGASSNGWISMFGTSTDRISVAAGGWFCNVAPFATGWTVTASTACNLKIDAGSSNISYQIAIIGCNA